jgi:sulfate adenylyltransferase large subunit
MGQPEASSGTTGGELLRLATAGSVDDGKSTLIGRLLADTGSLFDDQVLAATAATARRGDEGIDLALVTDGLRAEREQGITIDVAYRYFATARRTFIIADTPGHAQYTRNMVTGASTADLAVVLVDAAKGLTDQTRRHAAIAATLGIPRVVLAVNKMDLVGWSEGRFDDLAEEFTCFADPLGFGAITPIPLSALHGDNVVAPSAAATWYAGPTLLGHLEQVPVGPGARPTPPVGARLPVQWVIRPRPGSGGDGPHGGGQGGGERRYAATLAGGPLRVGDPVVVLPGGLATTVAELAVADGPVEEADVGAALTVRLADELDVSRGDLIASRFGAPLPTQEVTATVCWFAERPLRPGARLVLRHTTRTTRAIATELVDRLDVTTLGHCPAPDELALNDLGTVRFRLAGAIAPDAYAASRSTGSVILIDEATNDTVGAGLVHHTAG